MAKRDVFGLTPWGKAFIRAIEKLGDPGRLGRGRSYAANGKVTKLTIASGSVHARVRGSYQPYYTVQIEFPPFTRAEKDAITVLLAEDPLALARLNAGELPEGLLDRLEKAGIALFPARWEDMRRHCTCPDWGDPCKHQAAVYYVIAQELDRDPGALFRLRGLDLSAVLPEGGAAPAAPDGAASDPLGLRYGPAWPDSSGGDTATPEPAIGDYAGLMPRLLPDGPLLAALDLRVVLTEFYHRLARDWELPLLSAGQDQTVRFRALATGTFLLRLDGKRPSVTTPDGGSVGLLELAPDLLASDIDDGTPSYRFWRRFFKAMRALAAAAAFYPLARQRKQSLEVVWVPAYFGSDVRDLLAWVETAAIAPAYCGKKGFPDRPSLVRLLAADFLGAYVDALGFSPSGAAAADSPLSAALFRNAPVKTETPLYRSLPRALAARLAVYELAARQGAFELTVKTTTGSSVSVESATDRYRLYAGFRGTDGRTIPLFKAAAALGADVLAFPALLSNFVPSLAALGRRAGVELTEAELSDLVVRGQPLLSRIGVPVILPKELSKLAQPRRVLRAVRKGTGNLTTVLDLASLFSFEWAIEIGGRMISEAEFAALVAQGAALIRFRGQYVRLDPAEAARLLERVQSRRKADVHSAVQAVLSDEADSGEEAFAFLRQKLLARDAAGDAADESAPPPAGLRATLRPYQDRGYRWLLATLDQGFGCLLADDMGLGKTVQTIAALLAFKERGRLASGALVLAPAGLLANWERELGGFAPSLAVYVHYGQTRRLKTADVTLSTYDTFLRDVGHFADRQWDLAVLDEAHRIKNPDTKISRAVKSLSAAGRIALTGTPIENNLAELWSLFDFTLPGYLGPLAGFAREYRKPIEVYRSAESAVQLQRITAPFILRRMKTDKAIIPDLPDKIVIDEYTDLTPEQAVLYTALVTEGLARLEEADQFVRLGLVLALITALKQVANHPRNYDKESPATPERSGKTRLLLALLDAAFEAGERVLVFSQYVEMIAILQTIIRDDLGIEPYVLHGGLPKAKRDRAVADFQAGSGAGVFLISLKAGGVGLNLTAAVRVIHYDLWFNPAVENQATDRAFRIGQTRNVFVHRLITRDTLEEKIDRALAAKRVVAELGVGAGEQWITALGNDELGELIRRSAPGAPERSRRAAKGS